MAESVSWSMLLGNTRPELLRVGALAVAILLAGWYDIQWLVSLATPIQWPTAAGYPSMDCTITQLIVRDT